MCNKGIGRFYLHLTISKNQKFGQHNNYVVTAVYTQSNVKCNHIPYRINAQYDLFSQTYELDLICYVQKTEQNILNGINVAEMDQHHGQ